MLTEISTKSSAADEIGYGRSVPAPFPRYGYAGAGLILAAEALLFGGVPLVGVWFTPIVWTGYLLLINALVKRRKGTSLLSDYPIEFVLLLFISIASWVIFEGYNVLLRNWHYVGLPENLVIRYLGYAWSFSTISPAILVTFEFLDVTLPGRRPPTGRRLRNGLFSGFVTFGLACLIVPLLWPSPYLTPFVWMGFAFFLDPINGRLGERSFLTEFFTGHARSMLLLFLAGLICGILWEFWNFWAETKWHYDVPYWGNLKIFEMPVLGYLGFLPFAVECFAIYVVLRKLIPLPRKVRYLG